MATTVNDFVISKRITLTNDDGSEQEIQLEQGVGAGNKAWYLIGIRLVRTGGTGTTYQILMSENTGWTPGDVDEFYTGTAAVPVATKTWELQDPPVPFRTDSNGKVYWLVDWDAGNDNDAEVVFWFKGARGN